MDQSTINHIMKLSRPSRPRQSYSGKWMRRVFYLSLVLGVMAWFWKAVERVHAASRSAQCGRDFAMIALALHNYEASNGELPPAYLTDSEGRPTLSWRVLVLPYLGGSQFHRFHLSEPWDSPHNLKMLDQMPQCFACPNHGARSAKGLTKCVAITGPGTFFPGATPARFADATDGLDETIMLAEIGNRDIPWTAPVDLDIRTMSLRINDPSKPGISGPHQAGQTVCLGNGSALQISRMISPKALRALLTIAGGEPVRLRDEIGR